MNTRCPCLNTVVICSLALALVVVCGCWASAQAEELSPASSDLEEWGEIDLPPVSGSVKISRTLEGPRLPTRPEPDLGGVTWKVWGQLQLEASWQKDKDSQGKTAYSDRASLATAEIFGELKPVSFIRLYGHLLHEEGDSGINLDEGFVVLGQVAAFPGYLMGGRVYPVVGIFESYMVSDPITKDIFETQAIAVTAGWSGELLQASLAGYNPEVRRAGEGGSFYETYLLRAQLSLPPKALGGLKLGLGGSYTNNIAASGFFEEQVPGQRLDSLVAGFSLSLAAEYGPLTLLGEYIRSDPFCAGELDFAPPGSSPQPWAFNLELSWALAEAWRLTGRWEGGGDLYEEAPDRQGGLCLSWSPWPYLALALEYLHGEYSDGARQDLVTSQLSLIF
ncbi:MAG: LbtU family siderophore porin [Deltaproteobacteria bacterium]|nr:LbtU family siderophore porin [Deltaproteobacteria bacterium]